MEKRVAEIFYLELEWPNQMRIEFGGPSLLLLIGVGKLCEKEKEPQMQLLIVELHEMVTGFERLLGVEFSYERVKGAQMQLLIAGFHEMVLVAQRQPLFLEMVMVAKRQPLFLEMVILVGN